MTESSHCFWKCNRISGCRFYIMGLPEIVCRLLYTYLHPPIRRWWSQWVVMVALHCYLWCSCWWSDTLWATLIRLWLLSLSYYLQTVLEISLQFQTYALPHLYYIQIQDHRSPCDLLFQSRTAPGITCLSINPLHKLVQLKDVSISHLLAVPDPADESWKHEI